jgi:hypothetical protein
MNDKDFEKLVERAQCDQPAPQGELSDEDYQNSDKEHLGDQDFGYTAKPSVMEWSCKANPEGDWKQDFRPYDYADTAWRADKEYSFEGQTLYELKDYKEHKLTRLYDVLKGKEKLLGFDPHLALGGGKGIIGAMKRNDYTRYRFPYHRYAPPLRHQFQASSGNGWNILAGCATYIVGAFFAFSILLLIVLSELQIFGWSLFFITGAIVAWALYYQRWYAKHHDLTLIPYYEGILFDRKTGYILFIDDWSGKLNVEKWHYSEVVPAYFYTVTPNGVQEYHLVMFNRLNKKLFTINVTADKASLYLYIRFFSQFMDVSQPLPDVPHLEPFRPFDKTTREYDKKTKRDYYKWRKTDAEAFDKLCREAYAKVDKLCTSGVWIVKDENGKLREV